MIGVPGAVSVTRMRRMSRVLGVTRMRCVVGARGSVSCMRRGLGVIAVSGVGCLRDVSGVLPVSRMRCTSRVLGVTGMRRVIGVLHVITVRRSVTAVSGVGRVLGVISVRALVIGVSLRGHRSGLSDLVASL
ncbi:hypothetical protein [Nocardia xishanensis]